MTWTRSTEAYMYTFVWRWKERERWKVEADGDGEEERKVGKEVEKGRVTLKREGRNRKKGLAFIAAKCSAQHFLFVFESNRITVRKACLN